MDMMGRVNFGPALLQERKGLVGPGSATLPVSRIGPFKGYMFGAIGFEGLGLGPYKHCRQELLGPLKRTLGAIGAHSGL